MLLACHADAVLEEAESDVPMPHRCVAARVKLLALELAVMGLCVPSRWPRERRNVVEPGWCCRARSGVRS
ncbi:hypothetical protein LV78_003545 [Actinosynnema pretiosum]|nr:hypothetical protein [Actinosynnema pretiosum]